MTRYSVRFYESRSISEIKAVLSELGYDSAGKWEEESEYIGTKVDVTIADCESFCIYFHDVHNLSKTNLKYIDNVVSPIIEALKLDSDYEVRDYVKNKEYKSYRAKYAKFVKYAKYFAYCV